jgi:tripartite-type tricarboxylate transporter receptor subunit TctC
MTINRRHMLLLTALSSFSFAINLIPSPVQAQAAYPTRLVTIVVPSAPGGTTDFTARLLGDHLSRSLGQNFIIENIGGGAGNIGNTKVATAPPDGYTLLLSYSGYHVGNPHLFQSTGWDPLKSFEPVALAIKAPHVMLVRKDLPVTDLKSLITYAKANPGKLNYASAGMGSIQHIGTEQLKQLAGIEMQHIPYRGAGPAMQDLVGGTVDVFITTPPSAVGHVQAGNVKALAMAGPERHPVLKDTPTATEAGLPGYELIAWFALYAPAGTPKAIIERLATASKAAVASPEFIQKATANGAYASFMGPEQLGAFTKTELEFWGKVITSAKIKIE